MLSKTRAHTLCHTAFFQWVFKNCCFRRLDQPGMGATSSTALGSSGFSLNFSTTATIHPQYDLWLWRCFNSKPSAAASKSLATSWWLYSLASSRGLSPVLTFWLVDRIKYLWYVMITSKEQILILNLRLINSKFNAGLTKQQQHLLNDIIIPQMIMMINDNKWKWKWKSPSPPLSRHAPLAKGMIEK